MLVVGLAALANCWTLGRDWLKGFCEGGGYDIGAIVMSPSSSMHGSWYPPRLWILRAAGDVQGLSLPESVMSPMLEINECGGTTQRRLRGPNVVLVFAKKGIPEGRVDSAFVMARRSIAINSREL